MFHPGLFCLSVQTCLNSESCIPTCLKFADKSLISQRYALTAVVIFIITDAASIITQ